MKFDGNAVAGDLADVFGRDVTLAIATCAGCGARAVVARSMAYVTDMGSVLRCADCDSVLAVVVGTRDGVNFSMTGIASLRMPNGAHPTTIPDPGESSEDLVGSPDGRLRVLDGFSDGATPSAAWLLRQLRLSLESWSDDRAALDIDVERREDF